MTKVIIDLDDCAATALNRWLAKTAPAVGPPFLEAPEAISAMITVTLRYADVGDAVASQVRHQRAAGQERGRG